MSDRTYCGCESCVEMLEVLECIVANADEDCRVALDDLLDARKLIAKARGE